MYTQSKLVVECSKEKAFDTARAMLALSGLSKYQQVDASAERDSLGELDAYGTAGSWHAKCLGRCPDPDGLLDAKTYVWEVTFLLQNV
jgi:hypothetical protein